MELNKPKIGEACNGCGICCQIQICNTGAFLLRKVKYLGEKHLPGPCPALVAKEDGSFVCGFITNAGRFIRSKYRPEVISRTVATLVGAGSGCDELGYDDDAAEYENLEKLIEQKKSDEAWKRSAKKAIDLLLKF